MSEAAQADPEAVAAVVREVMGTVAGALTDAEASLLAEVEELGRVIASAKAEIAALRVDEITGSHIPTATDELDAIVAHTAAATDAILETCETLDRLGAAVGGGAGETLRHATTTIYEACGFQDITGQRITKVVAALKAIEAKVAQIVATFADRAAASPPASGLKCARPAPDAWENLPSRALENGPQLPANAMVQSDIDALLASFD
jgi:chemotaxis protein CheZ